MTEKQSGRGASGVFPRPHIVTGTTLLRVILVNSTLYMAL